LATALDRLVLPDDALVQALLHLQELLHLALQQAADRDARPAADDLGDVLLVDLLLEQLRRPASPLALRLGQLRSSSGSAVLQLRRARP
jgi:hypothetical protein